LQAVKPVSLIDHQTNSEERHLKNISVTVDGTNIVENIEKRNVQIKNGKFCYYTGCIIKKNLMLIKHMTKFWKLYIQLTRSILMSGNSLNNIFKNLRNK